MNYTKLNNIVGWVVWAIATYVYVSTIEPTASFWDCGEFIATAYRLEVGHPPGAPLFMLIARFFTLFASPENAAVMVNILSALSSSFTILFLYWTITLLAKKIALKTSGELTKDKIFAILGSGVVGALAYTFTDSFWFSAEEGEVYAMSSLFTAVVFWAILKWEESFGQPHNLKWLVLIAYLMGLSIGVHLLNLLAIPAIVFVFYFKSNPEVTPKGFIKAGILSIVILGVVQYGIIPGFFKIASWFELMFVNGFGLPKHSGLLFYIVLVGAAIYYGLKITKEKGNYIVNTALLCLTVILIGYSTYAVIIIRSSANPPMDENNPENVFTLLSYLNREQYGDRPLLYGQYFNSPLDANQPYIDEGYNYYFDKKTGKYEKGAPKSKPNYDKRFQGLLPRMWSPQAQHVRAYKKWSDFKGKPIKYTDARGETKIINKPTFGENMKFFKDYQLDWMYWRYFMWNFAGRQNDIQGHGGILYGNWISGIDFIDEARLGPQDNLPASMTENKAYNKFYMLPFILGLLGLVFQFTKDKKDWFVVFLLFFFTGIAIVIYLNQYPYQPRERDYAYAASFYAFSIWIGFGVYALYDLLKEKVKIPGTVAAVSVTLLTLVAVPGIMAKEGWDDHDRSHRYTARDFAKNYLDSCPKNAILFTNGDNDTFPLWYVQEVEGYRTDVRVVNLSLLNTDWYIEQMKRKAYDSDPIPGILRPEKYRQGTNDYIPIYAKFKEPKNVTQVIKFVDDDSKQSKIQLMDGSWRDYIPTNQFKVPVNKEKVKKLGVVDKEHENRIVDELVWKVNKNILYKNDLIILDILAANDWERPICFAITTGDDAYMNLMPYFELDGLVYRLVPYKAQSHDGQTGEVNTDIMYTNLMEKFQWGGMDSEHNIYMDENNRRMTMNLRNNFARLAEAFITKGEKEKAVEVLDRCLEVMPERNVPYNFFMLPIVESYYHAGANEKANALNKRLYDIYDDDLDYYMSLPKEHQKSVQNELNRAIAVLNRLVQLAQINGQQELYKELSERYKTLPLPNMNQMQ